MGKKRDAVDSVDLSAEKEFPGDGVEKVGIELPADGSEHELDTTGDGGPEVPDTVTQEAAPEAAPSGYAATKAARLRRQLERLERRAGG
jgi:hypothetical protein